ncbi:UNVERIFIED_CONTAM: hypothetical protein PYX00_002405 [Menopon gallinae]|uniref:Corticotropin-releasing factor domain-containing protein n=1 Tax=Menopon gallinae TaxID=328185 RepID=A0AAW2II12_9NEOP
MNQLTVILVLVLASTNASQYLLPLHQLQQDPMTRQISDDSPYASDGYDDPFAALLPRVNPDLNQMEGWVSVTDPRTYVFSELYGNTLLKPDDLRTKRTDAPLSITDALDVLRNQIAQGMARRRINQSKARIEKNRELLIKTGKRSHRAFDDPLRLEMQEFILRKRIQNDEMGKDLPVVSSKSNEDSSSTRRSQSEPGYQT